MNIPNIRGMNSLLNLSRIYSPDERKRRAKYVPSPEMTKKIGIIHTATIIIKISTPKLSSAFFMCQPSESKNLALWKKNTTSIAIHLSQSIS